MELSTAIDTMWVLLAAYLVFLMHAGFTMLEVGFTRAKNAVNIIMKNLLTISVGAVTFFVVGFGLMFGESLGGITGSSNFLLTGVEVLDFGVPFTAFWLFQAVFAATSATIVSGAVAERIKFIVQLNKLPSKDKSKSLGKYEVYNILYTKHKASRVKDIFHNMKIKFIVFQCWLR